MKSNKILSSFSASDREFIKRNAKKLKAITYLGMFCKKCGENLYEKPWLVEFHHIDPNIKDYSITDKMSKKSWEFIEYELNKCMLLCSKCHREIHYDIARFNIYKNEIRYLSVDNRLDELYRRKSTISDIKIAKEMFNRGCSYKEISDSVGFKESTLRIWLPMNKNFDFKSKENEEKIINLYVKERKTFKEICVILKCSFRPLKRKVIELVSDGKIQGIMNNKSNQHIKNPQAISIDGIKYVNATEASKKLGIGRSTIYSRLKFKRKGYEYL